jgi:hypothetical protein
MTTILALINFLAFEAAWFAAVHGGATGHAWLGSVPALLVVLLHLAMNRPYILREVKLIAAVTLFGTLIETGFMGAGFLTYAGTEPGQMLPPVWVIALWFGFGTLPNASLAWLRTRPFLQVLMGAIAGPLTYWGGAEMGAATLSQNAGSALFGIGFAWALALPVIFMLADALSEPYRRQAAGN